MRVAALYRHPIKSHGREKIAAVELTEGMTMPWDRVWAVTHEATKFDASAPAWVNCRNFMLGARTPGLAGIWASLDETSRRITLRHQDLEELTFRPDDEDDLGGFLSWVAPLCPDNRAKPARIVSVPGRGMTDSTFPSVSVMNLASHDAVAAALKTPMEIERWRGNIWLEGAPVWAEMEWLGRDLRIGDAVLRVHDRIKRCTVTNTNPVTGLRDLATLDILNNAFGHQDFGVYAEVVETGHVHVGSKVELI